MVAANRRDQRSPCRLYRRRFEDGAAAEAKAKLTFRLVGRQTPASIRKGLRDFVKARLPADCRVRYKSEGGDSMAGHPCRDESLVRLAQSALRNEWAEIPS